MSKFKVGDKVIPVKIDGVIHKWLREGALYLIKNIHEGDLVDIVELSSDQPTLADGRGDSWSEDWFELYEENGKEMTAERIREDILHIEKRIEEAKKDIASMEEEKNVLIEKLKEKGFILVDTTTAPIPPIVQDIESLEELKVGETYLVTNKYGCAHRNLVGKEVVVTDIDGFANELFVEVVNEGSYDCDWMHYKDLAKIKT